MTSEEKYHRKEWMDETQWGLSMLAAGFCGGFHHCHDLKRCGTGIMFNTPRNRLATYDFDGLTHLVAMGHRHLIRIGVENETRDIEVPEDLGGGTVEVTQSVITMHQRIPVGDDTRMFEHHPTLSDNLERLGYGDLVPQPKEPT